MSRISQLTPLVVNKIAAGEVIERPASVVKELLENSIDALATRIEVDIEQGGVELIRVVDDGEGIHPDDLTLAVTSHATSKIRSDDDLFHVQTLGFRGEALASIASVSRMAIRSRLPDADSGFQIEASADGIGAVQPCGAPAGTRIEVRQLFANTPVRRKFLRSPSTEFGHISEQFTRVALAHSRVHAVLRHNGKVVYEIPASGDLLGRLRLFYGDSLSEELIHVDEEAHGIRLWGYVAHPSQSKATRKGQYLFLNGRWIQDRTLQHALTEAYRGLLMVGRQPIAYLFLEMPPDLVDVNVHPTKAEVRFRDGQQLYRLLLSTLRTRFLSMDLDSDIHVGAGRGLLAAGAPAVTPEFRRELQSELVGWAKDQLAQWSPSSPAQYTTGIVDEPPPNPFARQFESRESPPTSWPAAIAQQPAAWDRADRELESTAPASMPDASSTPFSAPQSAAASPTRHGIGDVRAMQIHDSYLVVETPEGMTVIDQHALHERIMYEHFRQRVLSGSVETQRLLVPLTIEVAPNEAGVLTEHLDVLKELGFALEEFGKGTFLLQGYPVMLRKADPVDIVRDLAEQLDRPGRPPERRDLLDSMLHMMACKAAIKAGDRLTPEEMESLLAQRFLIDDAHHCPHGRPTSLSLSRAELDRQFGRMG